MNKIKITWISFLGLFIAFLLMVVSNQIRFNQYLSSSRYENIAYHYIVPKPGIDQIREISSESHISQIVPFYKFDGTLRDNNQNTELSIYIINSLVHSPYTNFSNERLLQSIDDVNNSIYIDYNLSQKANLGLGDNINLYFSDYSFNYTVTRIYEIDNSYVLNDGVAMIEIDDILNQHFITSDYTYAGAYITSNLNSETSSYLYDYKPLGILKNREMFDSDETYNNYLTSFYSANYSNEITTIDHLKQINEITVFEKLVTFVIGIVSFFVLITAFLLIKVINHKKNMKSYYHQIEQGDINVSLKYLKYRFIVNFIVVQIELLILVLAYFLLYSWIIYPSFKFEAVVLFNIFFIIIYISSYYQEFMIYRIQKRNN